MDTIGICEELLPGNIQGRGSSLTLPTGHLFTFLYFNPKKMIQSLLSGNRAQRI